jgi:hypothetical protein
MRNANAKILDTIHGRLDSKRRVPLPPEPSKLSHAEKDALILELIGQLASVHEIIAALNERIHSLESRPGRLTQPAETPDNSSKPPGQRQKPNRPGGDRPPRVGRPGVARTLPRPPIA